jgi:hypothetical protein
MKPQNVDTQADGNRFKHCHGDFFSAEAGDIDLNNPELADVSYNNEVDSFRCVSS